jgi:L-amino acid N-acyltransferase YncA
MIFKDATINDLEEIVFIYNSTIASRLVTADTEPVTVEQKLDWFNAHNTNTRPLWMVYDNENKPCIGWVSFQNFYGRPAYSGTAEISIYLHPNCRRKGFGKSILIYALDKCKALQIHTLLGFIFAHNLPSIRLFEQLGFQTWATLPEVAIMDNQKYSLQILGKKIE